MSTKKIDLKKELKSLYNPKKEMVVNIEIPKMNFLMLNGKGDPNTSKEFSDGIQTLFPLAYALKFKIKKTLGIDYGVMPLEGLWWSDNFSDFSSGKKDNWYWTIMIMQPDCVSENLYQETLKEVKDKKNPPSIDKVRFESFTEGKSAQIMHIGSFATEGENIKKIHEFIKSLGGKFDGMKQKHHEIYLNDFRKTAPEKLKTILRQSYI